MKTINTILAILITVVGLSQNYKTYDLNECPMYSKVWSAKYVPSVFVKGEKVTEVKSFDGTMFDLGKNRDILKSVDESKVEKLLLESFNQFRTDYKIPKVIENVEVSRQADEYSKNILVNYGHDKSRPKDQSECIGILPVMMLSNITKSDGDINKIIADCCFDLFVGCPAHMSLLLDPTCKSYGFGITVTDNKVSVVVRGMR